MFGELLESRPRKERRGKVAAVSAAAHAVVIVLAAVATATAESRHEEPAEPLTELIYRVLPEWREPRQAARPPGDGAPTLPTPPRDRPPPLPTVDVDVDEIPRVDLGGPAPGGELPFGPTPTGETTQPGAGEHADGAGRGGARRPAEVEKAALALPGPAPRYPEILRSAGIEGRVVVQFVVDTAGRVEPASVRVVESKHELFAAAVRAALPGMRFAPAEVGGRSVRQLVQMPFKFELQR